MAPGEIRIFRCNSCGTGLSRFFTHFEAPEVFPVVECPRCRGQATLATRPPRPSEKQERRETVAEPEVSPAESTQDWWLSADAKSG